MAQIFFKKYLTSKLFKYVYYDFCYRDKVSKKLRPWEIIQIYKRSIEPEDFDFEVDKTLILRQNKTESLPEQQTCAVVGNSGILSDSNCGRAIDSHDYIYRMNLAPFGQEYGKDVGYKTNITTLNYSQLTSMAKCAKKRFANMSPACASMLTNMKLYNHSVIWYPKGGSRKGNMNTLSRGMKDIFNFTAGWAYSPVSLFGVVPRYYVIENAKNMGKKGTVWCKNVSKIFTSGITPVELKRTVQCV